MKSVSSGQGLVFLKGISSYSPDAPGPITCSKAKATQDNSRRTTDIKSRLPKPLSNGGGIPKPRDYSAKGSGL